MKVQELVEITADVVGEGLAGEKTAFAVEGQSGVESGAAAGLQAEARQSQPARFGNDMPEQASGGALAQKIRMGPHGFDLAGTVRQHFERADGGQMVAPPNRPDRHAGRLQAGEIEREDAARRGIFVHAGQVERQQRSDFRRGKIIFANFEQAPLRCPGNGTNSILRPGAVNAVAAGRQRAG